MKVYKWLLKEGYASGKIVLAGDSSGACLCLSVLAALCNDTIDVPAACVCISPLTDMKGTGKSFISKADVDPSALKDPLSMVKHYVGENDRSDPHISPLYAALSGFPPILIHASEYDVFLDDATRFAEKANLAGVDVTLKIWKKMWHVFHMNSDILPEGRLALKEICDYVDEKI